MIPIKIQCGCGQRYAFDIEPVNGQMPSVVACPVCGADGTAAADAFIAQSMPAQPTVAATPDGEARLRVANPPAVHPVHAPAPAATSRGGALRGAPRIDRTQVEFEAKAKISWGDPPQEVVKYLMMQGIDYEEASSMVDGMFKERAATTRRNGIKKLVIGAALVCVPIVACVVFLSVGFFPVKVFGLTLMAGLYGAWLLLRGAFMLLAPKSEAGDVAEQ